MLNPTISSNESNFVKEEVVEPIYEAITGKKEVDFDVRKLAHMIEFGVLGLEATLFFNNDSVISRAFKVVGFCFLVAFIDETIQIFSDRGSSIFDVYIDLSGVLISFIIVSSILAIVNKVSMRKRFPVFRNCLR